MKKTGIFSALVFAFLVCHCMAFVSYGAEKTVRVSLPAFRVQINGTIVNSKTAKYPLLVYKDITYMPMTYDYCNLLGLESGWTKEDGLNVWLRTNNTVPTVTEQESADNNPSHATASVVGTPVTINGKKINNSKEPYPFLRYKDITYFPLTFKFTHEEFNIYSNFIPDIGLGVYSENKFFYRYYPEGSKQQHIDLRLSTILYSMVAINISDGTGKYPSNNVAMYDYYRCGAPLYPNFKGTKYYGYLPDGSGGLKANVDSKLSIGNLITTEINDVQNTTPVNVELSFYAFYQY